MEKMQETVVNKCKFLSWKGCNDIVLSWILNSMESDLGNSKIYAESATEVWDDLKDISSQNNAKRNAYQRKKRCMRIGEIANCINSI